LVLLAEQRAASTDSVLSRRELAAIGIDSHDIDREVGHGRWTALGRHSVVTHRGPLTERSMWRHALHEVGSHGALDGVSALRAAGMAGFEDVTVVSVRHGWQPVRVPGLVVHELRDWRDDDVVGAGLRRVRPSPAAIRAASWARSRRQAALILVVTAQQRITRATDMCGELARFKRLRRRRLIQEVLLDVIDGVQALGELDFARECRRRGLPQPSRQVLRRGPRGRAYLDVYWDEYGLVVEIEGAHHDAPLNAVDDALRQNALTSEGERVLRIPVIGLRTDPDRFMAQVEACLIARGWRRTSACG
jgi:very-short-patch-repair endonuclease